MLPTAVRSQLVADLVFGQTSSGEKELCGFLHLLVEWTTTRARKKRDSTLPDTPYVVQKLNCQVPRFRAGKLLSSSIDGSEHPSREVLEQYHGRWHVERTEGNVNEPGLFIRLGQREANRIRLHNPRHSVLILARSWAQEVGSDSADRDVSRSLAQSEVPLLRTRVVKPPRNSYTFSLRHERYARN